nr:uncharacterized protein LOC111420800 [Onthophagus taurus]
MLWVILFINLFITSGYATKNSQHHDEHHQERIFGWPNSCRTYNDTSASLQQSINNDKLIYMVLTTRPFTGQCFKCSPAGSGSSTYFNCNRDVLIPRNFNIENPKIVKYVPKEYVIVYSCKNVGLFIPRWEESVYVLTASSKLTSDREREIRDIITGMRLLYIAINTRLICP